MQTCHPGESRKRKNSRRRNIWTNSSRHSRSLTALWCGSTLLLYQGRVKDSLSSGRISYGKASADGGTGGEPGQVPHPEISSREPSAAVDAGRCSEASCSQEFDERF